MKNPSASDRREGRDQVVTLPQALFHNASTQPDGVALREKEFGIWQEISWRRYAERTRDFGIGLAALGFSARDHLAILGDNRPEWLIAELAAQALGGCAMGIYQDSVAEEVLFLLEFSGARFVVAEDQEQVDKIFELRRAGSLPDLTAVIHFDSRGLSTYDDPLLRSFESVAALAATHPEARAAFERALAAGTSDDVALLAPTSGTTGKPKLAMLTQRNLLSMSRSLQEVDPMRATDDFVSMLPLAWIGEQMISVGCALVVGFTVNFPEEPETAREDLREMGPQTMFSPPRIWETLLSEIQVKHEDSSALKRFVFRRALASGYAVADARRGNEDSRSSDFGLRCRRWIAEWTCFFWLRDQLGLRRIRNAYTGGAALGPDVFRFFHAIGVNLKQIYGQTEVSGISVVHRNDDIKYHTVGVPVPGTQIILSEDGEIRTKSDAVFAGYYRNPGATEQALKDGWLCSGDAGQFDEDGHLIVIDRVKDVMTLADGSRFSPQFLENKLKFSPYVQEAVVFGGGEFAFTSALLTLDFANAGKWAERHQIPYSTFADLSQKTEIIELVRTHVEAVNGDLAPAARLRRFLLLHKELDADDSELTRTRKVRRAFVAERHAQIIGALYGSEDRCTVNNEVTYRDGSSAVQTTVLLIETLDTGAQMTDRQET